MKIKQRLRSIIVLFFPNQSPVLQKVCNSCNTDLERSRITEYLQLERTHKHHRVQLPFYHLKLNPMTKTPVQTIPLPLVLSLVTRERSSAHLCSTYLFGKVSNCNQVTPQLFSSPGWINQITSITPLKFCPQDLSPSLLPSSGNTQIVWCFCYIEQPKITHGIWGRAAAEQCRVGRKWKETIS